MIDWIAALVLFAFGALAGIAATYWWIVEPMRQDLVALDAALARCVKQRDAGL